MLNHVTRLLFIPVIRETELGSRASTFHPNSSTLTHSRWDFNGKLTCVYHSDNELREERCCLKREQQSLLCKKKKGKRKRKK